MYIYTCRYILTRFIICKHILHIYVLYLLMFKLIKGTSYGFTASKTFGHVTSIFHIYYYAYVSRMHNICMHVRTCTYVRNIRNI